MPVTTYTTIDGEIVSQDVNGTVHDLLPDPLGHTVGLIGSGQGIEFEYTYWPYEEIGSIDDVATALRYVGTLGYYSDDYGSPRVYVRARHYRGPYGRWLTVDPLWPGEEPYAYAASNPATRTDTSGLIVLFCYRPVCLVPYKPVCHWYLSTSLCGDVGYGTGGVIYGSGNPGTSSWQRPVNCVPQTYSAAQEKCICDNVAAASAGGVLCGTTWVAGTYHWARHNCQMFVNCILKKCTGGTVSGGLGAPRRGHGSIPTSSH